MPTETRHQIIQRAILAAFGCVKLDYRSPRRLDEAASIVADFVCAELDRVDTDPDDARDRAAALEQARLMRADTEIGYKT